MSRSRGQPCSCTRGRSSSRSSREPHCASVGVGARCISDREGAYAGDTQLSDISLSIAREVWVIHGARFRER